MATCRKCHTELPKGALFCPACGAKQEVSKTPKRRGNGQGSAIKRGQTWTAIWTVGYSVEDGKLHQLRRWKGGFATKKDALAFANTPREAVPVPTLRHYWDSWSTTDLLDIGKSKQEAYRIAWKKIQSIADVPVKQLNIEKLQQVVDAKAKTYYPAKDIKILLSHLYKRAMAEQQVLSNLAEFIRLPTLEEKVGEPFTEQELAALWSSYQNGNWFIGAVLLMIYTGMMPGELLKLTTDMIDWGAREIVGVGLKTNTRKKLNLVFPPLIEPVLSDLITHSTGKTGRIFDMSKNKFYQTYHKAIQQAGVRDLPAYSCRHTTATALAMGNVSPTTIQSVMRHAKFSSTERYIHPDRRSAHDAVSTLSGMEKSQKEP